MKKIAVALFLCLILVFACLSTGDADRRATVDDFAQYTSWYKVNEETVTGDETGLLGPAHAGAQGFREVYINDLGKGVSDGNSDLPYPQGTIIVKESYGKASDGGKGQLTGITVMVKQDEEYDPENGNWEYLNVSPNMKVTAQGKIGMCINCHAAAEDDYVFTDNIE